MASDDSLKALTGWAPIEAGSGFEDAINFFGEFRTPEGKLFANQALRAAHARLGTTSKRCYCYALCLEIDANNQGYFRRHGDVVMPSGETAPPPALFWNVPLERLIPDLRTWPALALRIGPPQDLLDDLSIDPELRTFFERVSWQVAIRMQDKEQYVGYLKFMGMVGTAVPDKLKIITAAYEAKSDIASLFACRRIEATKANREFKNRLHIAAHRISHLAGLDARLALRHTADMLTSHLGAGWNRAACYWPVRQDMLRCLWAQGGGGDWEWCEQVQRKVTDEIREVESLTSVVNQHPYPLNDPYYLAAAGERPVEIELGDAESDNILAKLWRANGDVRQLPAENQYWETLGLPAARAVGAVEIGQHDPWVQEVQSERPRAPIFKSRNGRYFAIPWYAYEELIAIWVVDMAYWGVLREQPDAPSLAFTYDILAALGPAMECHRSKLSQWPKWHELDD